MVYAGWINLSGRTAADYRSRRSSYLCAYLHYIVTVVNSWKCLYVLPRNFNGYKFFNIKRRPFSSLLFQYTVAGHRLPVVAAPRSGVHLFVMFHQNFTWNRISFSVPFFCFFFLFSARRGIFAALFMSEHPWHTWHITFRWPIPKLKRHSQSLNQLVSGIETVIISVRFHGIEVIKSNTKCMFCQYGPKLNSSDVRVHLMLWFNLFSIETLIKLTIRVKHVSLQCFWHYTALFPLPLPLQLQLVFLFSFFFFVSPSSFLMKRSAP